MRLTVKNEERRAVGWSKEEREGALLENLHHTVVCFAVECFVRPGRSRKNSCLDSSDKLVSGEGQAARRTKRVPITCTERINPRTLTCMQEMYVHVRV